MSTKRYQPSLIMIPEEYGANQGSDTYASYAASRRNSSALSQNNNARRKSASSASCAGCPGCSSENASNKIDGNSNCKNCGDKRNSIRKWLEEVSTHESDRHSDPENEHNILDKVPANKTHNTDQSNQREKLEIKYTVESGSSSDSDTIKANSIRSNKRKAPPVPTAAPPKIISHFMKREESINDNHKSDLNNNQKLYSKNSLQSLAEQSKIYDKLELYDQLAKSGSELFNNPQFQHGSPHLSQRSQNSRHSQKSRSKIEVLDQFSNPHQNRHYEIMKNLHQMPDMVYEAMAKDFTKRKINNDNVYGQISLPTPDYDEPLGSKKIYDDIPNYVHVPTPDYNTYGRAKPHPQPDSPVYTRKSPHHLIVDYETDSLERSTTTKMGRVSSTPPSNSSDLCSQPSPSLSVALPLEEEVEVRNTVYDRVEGFRKDGVDSMSKAKLVRPRTPAKLYEDINSNYAGMHGRPMLPPKEPRIKYNTPSQGSMTIEVEHEPSDCEVSTDSEQFEPDTLDRKPKKISILASKNSNAAWSQHMIKSADFLNHSDEKVQYSSLENMTSLPDMKNLQNSINSQLVLRSSGSFKSNSLNNFTGINTLLSETNLQKSFNSLREIYEAKNAKNLQANLNNLSESEKGRLLTLEARHSKRQRQTNVANTLKKPIPPDVIPSESNKHNNQHIIYDNPKTPSRPVEGLMHPRLAGQKNLTGWNTDDSNGQNDDYATSSDHDTLETSSSEATEVTGVSDTQINSEFESDHRQRLMNSFNGSLNSMSIDESISRQYSKVQKMSKFHINHGSVRQKDNARDDDGDDGNNPHYEDSQRITILENFMTLGDVRNKNFTDPDQSDLSDTSTLKSDSTNFNYKKNMMEANQCNVAGIDAGEADMDKIEIVSSKSISIQNPPSNMDDATNNVSGVSTASIMQELAGSTRNFELNATARTMPTKVFRVDVNPSTHGMQIALGLKDRVKKSKDLKYAWKKFVNIATSKFQGSSPKTPDGGQPDLDGLEKCSVLSEGDDGISSMHDESITVHDHDPNGQTSGQISRTPSSTSDASKRTTRNMRTDPDSGYMSADSNESKIHSKKLYERFNFKAAKNVPIAGTSSDATDCENDFAQKNMSRMQEIKESAELEKASTKSSVSGSGSNKSTPTNTIDQRPSVTGFIPKSFMLQMPGESMLQVNVYSSDEERYSSGMSSESDEEYNLEDMCESGAESVETNSVFFKNVRKPQQKAKNSTDGGDKK